MKIPFKWIQIDDVTYRAKVIGGWVLRMQDVSFSSDNEDLAMTSTFIPDPEHKWEIV